MNRIILIGNGFDLAHGLKTSYTDFIADYWRQFSEKMYRHDGDNVSLRQHDEDPLTEFLFEGKYNKCICLRNSNATSICSFTGLDKCVKRFREETNDYLKYYKIHTNPTDKELGLHIKSTFFYEINRDLTDQKWVDIENVYYRLLKDIHRRYSNAKIAGEDTKVLKDELEKLNNDLGIIKDQLKCYLNAQDGRITRWYKNIGLDRIMHECFQFQDISNEGQDAFWKFQEYRLSHAYMHEDLYTELKKYEQSLHTKDLEKFHRTVEQIEQAKRSEHKRRVLNPRASDPEIPRYFLNPENVLFVNFNYTRTAELYIPGLRRDRLNHIHGELGNPDNPMIFGYGDEMDENYKNIVNLNENEYLKNIKSIRYLETDNYRRLLTFIDSAPYQIYIMGHSCGNSDRTLLNTLFEHDNCVSIKPFYYEKEDGTDDYIDIVQNISRNFKDPAKMRDRVVNKTFCEPMPQNETAQKSE